MSDTLETDPKTQLALALARGVSVASWALANNVPRTTAFNWARDAEVQKMVQACRRRVLDQAIGLMARSATKAAGVIVHVAENSESDSVRLRAARAVFSDMIAVSKFSELEARITEFEEELRKDPTSFAPLPRR